MQRSNFLAPYKRDFNVQKEHLPSLANLIPQHIIKRYRILPLEKNGDVLTLGAVEQNAEDLYSILQRYVSHYRIEWVQMTEAQYQEYFADMYRERHGLSLVSESNFGRQSSQISRDLELLIQTASRLRASDIHMEMQKDGMIFRFRIDGQLQDGLEKVSLEIGRHLINRLKILAKLDIAETRMPQDGQISVDELPESGLSAARLSLVPTMFGEKAVLRLHRGELSLLPIELLCPNRQIALKLQEIAELGEGLILVAGPTGAGKTSTLYAMLHHLNKNHSHIISVEDPVETIIPGVTQIPVLGAIGRSYAAVLRHILRQDPDIIMIGEIRDGASASIAFDAAVTGHLVLSTIHATDSLSVLPRLTELSIPHHTISSGLNAVISQRLLRSICTECKTTRPTTPRERKVLERLVPKKQIPNRVHLGNGCERCHFTGYYDRIAVFEVWQKTPRLHQKLLAHASMPELIQEIRAEGFQSLMEVGMQMALQGLTSIEEVLKNCPQPPYPIHEGHKIKINLNEG